MRWHQSHQRSGFSLVEVLMAVAILGIAAVIVAAGWDNVRKTNSLVKLTNAIDEVRARIIKEVDCGRSLRDPGYYNGSTGVTTCPGSTLNLVDVTGATIVSSVETRVFGNYFAFTECAPTGLTVRVTKKRGTGYARHPLTDEVLDGNASLNPIIGGQKPFQICSQYFGVRARVARFEIPFSEPELASRGISIASADAVLQPTDAEMWSAYPTAFRVDDACVAYCQRPANGYQTGMAHEFSAAGVTCTCLR